MTQLTAVIPFHGFYESVHSEALDEVADEGDDPIINYAQYREDYSKEYVVQYRDLMEENIELELHMSFESLESPKEYNFETDRIFVSLPETTLTKLLAKVDYGKWAENVKEMFTSRDGFSSYYSPSLADWLDDAKPLDHCQIGSLLLTLTEQYAEEDYANLCSLGIDSANDIAEEHVCRP